MRLGRRRPAEPATVRSVSLAPTGQVALAGRAPQEAAGDAALVLRQRRSGAERRAPVRWSGDGDFEAVLDLSPNGSAEEWLGYWDAHLVAGPESERRLKLDEEAELARPVRLDDGDAAGAGGGDSPVRLRAYGTAHGNLSLALLELSGRAIAERVVVGETTLELSGPLPSGPFDEPRLVAVNRADAEELERPVSATPDGAFTAALDLHELVVDAERTQIWDLFLQGSGRRLRLRAPFDDVPDRNEIVVFPQRTLRRDGVERRIFPYYTVDDDLSLRSRPARAPSTEPDPAQPGAEPAPRRPRAGRPWTPVLWVIRRGIVRLVRAALHAGARPSAAEAPARTKVTILIMHAYGMGGTIRTVFNLAGHLARDHDVEIVSLVRRRDAPFLPVPPGVTVTNLADRRPSAPTTWLARLVDRIPSLLVHEEDYAFSSSSAWTDLLILRTLRRLRSGVLLATRPAFNVIAADFAAPGIVTIGQEHMNFTAHRPGLAKQIRRSYPKLDALAVLTHDDLRDYGAMLAGAPTRVARIPNALPELPGARSDVRAPVVVAAGRLTWQKGFDLLVEAFAEVARERPDWTLRIFGDGQKHKQLRRMILERELYNNVFLMGATQEIGPELSRASIFALSSRFEGFGMVLLEAMSKGVPVVSFDCPRGPSEIVHPGEDGLLVSDGDPHALAQGILELAGDEDRRRQMGERAIETARAFGVDAIGARWDELLAELAGPEAVRA